jgi:hypothetical protein
MLLPLTDLDLKRLSGKCRQEYRTKIYHNNKSSVPEKELLPERKMERTYKRKEYK